MCSSFRNSKWWLIFYELLLTFCRILCFPKHLTSHCYIWRCCVCCLKSGRCDAIHWFHCIPKAGFRGNYMYIFYRNIFTTYEDICYHKTDPWLLCKTIHFHLYAQLADFYTLFWFLFLVSRLNENDLHISTFIRKILYKIYMHS
jgi:hypothetical protein